MAQRQQKIHPLVKPLIEGYQERMQKYKTELETLQNMSKKVGSEYATLVQKVHENELVLAEIQLLADEAKIFKQVGPALIPKTKEDASSNVKSRLELLRNNKTQKETELNGNKKKMISIQQDMQKAEGDFKNALNGILQQQQGKK